MPVDSSKGPRQRGFLFCGLPRGGQAGEGFKRYPSSKKGMIPARAIPVGPVIHSGSSFKKCSLSSSQALLGALGTLLGRTAWPADVGVPTCPWRRGMGSFVCLPLSLHLPVSPATASPPTFHRGHLRKSLGISPANWIHRQQTGFVTNATESSPPGKETILFSAVFFSPPCLFLRRPWFKSSPRPSNRQSC